MQEENREIWESVRIQKEKNTKLIKRDQVKIEVKSKKVYLDGEPMQKQLSPIEVDELFPDKVEKDKQDKLKFSVSDSTAQEGSTFVAYATKTGTQGISPYQKDACRSNPCHSSLQPNKQ